MAEAEQAPDERKALRPPMDEAHTLARARHGDPEAFGLLIDAYKQRILTHVLRMVKHRQEAEDLAQETFLRAYRFLHLYDPARPFRSWLYAIATNTALNGLRSRGRRNPGAPFDETLHTYEASVRASGSQSNPRHDASKSELADTLGEAIATLNPMCAALIHLHYTEGMSIRDAAEVVGMTEGAAKTALCRARKQLRERLIKEDLP